MRGSTAALLVLMLALSPVVARAQVYEWLDEQGTLHYTTELERVPERFRAGARRLAVPRGPAGVPAEPALSSAAAGTTVIRFAPGGPILVEARINGAGPVTLVLDTGADRTMVAPAALARLGIATPNTLRTQIQGVTGATQADLVWVSAVEVGGMESGPLPIVVHDAELGRADGLLGRDFLSLFTVTIDTTASQVTLTRK
jgi:predicted aspartyl protease